ncbi:MAG: FAD-dependent oxidoreductase [Sneathiellaceae bacterium]
MASAEPVTAGGAGARPRHVTVVGAGIVGICSAAYLQRQGFAVTVLDRVAPGMATSFGNAGSLSPSAVLPVAMPGMTKRVPGWLMDPLGPLTVRWRYLPFVAPWLIRFLRHAKPEEVRRVATAMSSLLTPVFDCYDPLLKAAGAQHLVRRNGCLYVYETEAEFAAAGRLLDLRRDLGATLDVVGPDEMHQLEPALNRKFVKGIFAPDNGSTVDPAALVTAIAGQVVADGGEILQAEVRDLEIGPDGPVALLTDSGRRPVDGLVIAAGAWSRRLARRLGHDVPLETQRGYHVTLAEPGVTVNRTVMWNRRSVFANPMIPGLRVAGTVELAGLDAAPNYARAEKLAAIGAEMFPGVNTASPSHWMGHRPCLPDSLPVIDRARRFPNVVFAFGHQHVGMCAGAPTGRLVAQLMAGAVPDIDLAPFRVDRFGSLLGGGPA